MKKVIFCLLVLLISNSSYSQSKITLGGTNSTWSLPASVTIMEGTILNITATSMHTWGFTWSTSSPMNTFFHTQSSFTGPGVCSVAIQFFKPGVYSVGLFVNSFNGPGGQSATVIVLPKWKKNYFNQ